MSVWQKIRAFFNPPRPLGFPMTCVPHSLMCAWVFGQNGYRTRIAVQNISKGVDHAQAEALVDGTWTPLTLLIVEGVPTVTVYRRHFPQEPYRYLTLREWVDEQISYAEVKER